MLCPFLHHCHPHPGRHSKRRFSDDVYSTTRRRLLFSLLVRGTSGGAPRMPTEAPTSDGTEMLAEIVETEAYLGSGLDRASHSYSGQPTPRTQAMFMVPGTLYVYPIYGVHLCVNVSSVGDGAAVLLRALRPLKGAEEMRARRGKTTSASNKKRNREMLDLCDGPAKMCQAMDITRDFDRKDLTTLEELYLTPDEDGGGGGGGGAFSIVRSRRVGIGASAGEEAVERRLRFYRLRDAEFVSKRDKSAEREAEERARENKKRKMEETKEQMKEVANKEARKQPKERAEEEVWSKKSGR